MRNALVINCIPLVEQNKDWVLVDFRHRRSSIQANNTTTDCEDCVQNDARAKNGMIINTIIFTCFAMEYEPSYELVVVRDRLSTEDSRLMILIGRLFRCLPLDSLDTFEQINRAQSDFNSYAFIDLKGSAIEILLEF